MNHATPARRSGFVFGCFYWLTIGVVFLAMLSSIAGLVAGAVVLYKHVADPQETTTISD